MSQTDLSNNYKIDALLSSYQWGDENGAAATISYSFPDTNSTWEYSYGQGEPFYPYYFTPLNTQEKTYFRYALNLWSDVANINFVEVSDSNSSTGDIRVAFSSIVSSSTTGYAHLPIVPSATESGDIWLNINLFDFSPGTQGFSTYIHEIGHALGLKHPFSIEPENSTTLPTAEDTNQYTMMSYVSYDGAGYTEIPNQGFYTTQASTTMLYDIAAIQFLYGANTSTRTGDDIYTFSNTIPISMTIWDAGGNDTIDLSNQNFNMKINLSAGTFSSIGVITEKELNGYIVSTLEAAVDNIAIAYGVEIENAIGGDGNDILIGNTLDNQLTGGSGNDILMGSSGEDIAIYSGKRIDYELIQSESGLQVPSKETSEGIDTLIDIEKIQFSDLIVNILAIIPQSAAEVILSPEEGNSNHINYFLLEISSVLSTDATVNYHTQDGTALAGSDYIATSGIAIITAGELNTVIGVEIIADEKAEASETFSLIITNPNGALFPNDTLEIAATHTIIDDDTAISNAMESEIQLIGISESF